MVARMHNASSSQLAALAIVPKVSAFFSVLASAYIINDIAFMYRRQRSAIKNYHRILLGISITGLISSLAWFLTTWPMPEGTPQTRFSAGNQASCSTQGFLTHLSVATVLYFGWQSIYYCLAIYFGWSDDRLRPISWIAHLTSIGLAMGTSTTSLLLGLFNPNGWDCWIASIPIDCKETWLHGEDEANCIRGDNATLYQWVFFYLPLWCVFAVVVCCMWLVYRVYRKQAISTRKFLERQACGNASIRSESANKAQLKRNRIVITQAFLYVGSFIFVWTFPTILRVHETIVDQTAYHWVLLSSIFLPTQGIWNLFIYLRPKLVQRQRDRERQLRMATVCAPTPIASANSNVAMISDIGACDNISTERGVQFQVKDNTGSGHSDACMSNAASKPSSRPPIFPETNQQEEPRAPQISNDVHMAEYQRHRSISDTIVMNEHRRHNRMSFPHFRRGKSEQQNINPQKSMKLVRSALISARDIFADFRDVLAEGEEGTGAPVEISVDLINSDRDIVGENNEISIDQISYQNNVKHIGRDMFENDGWTKSSRAMASRQSAIQASSYMFTLDEEDGELTESQAEPFDDQGGDFDIRAT